MRVGREATGYSRWFERLLAELGIEVWIGDAAKIKAKRVRKQKTDHNDAQLLLALLIENKFPRVRIASPENRDVRQLLWHRHRLVQMRMRIMNQLHARATDAHNVLLQLIARTHLRQKYPNVSGVNQKEAGCFSARWLPQQKE